MDTLEDLRRSYARAMLEHERKQHERKHSYERAMQEHERQLQLELHNIQMQNQKVLRMRRHCLSKIRAYIHRSNHLKLGCNLRCWKTFVQEYYDSQAVEKWCFASCNTIEMDKIWGDCMTARQCKICGLSSTRHYEANFTSLPHVLKSKFGTGMVKELLRLGDAEGEILANGDILLECKKAVREMSYKQLSVFHEGTVRFVFTKNFKIFSWDFCSRKVEVRPTQASVTQLNTEIIRAANVNYSGLPRSYCMWSQMAENFDTMEDIMDLIASRKSLDQLFRVVPSSLIGTDETKLDTQVQVHELRQMCVAS